VEVVGVDPKAGERVQEEIFEENEGGNYFMFMENPDKFNRIVRDFIG
jgi:hypothetical protein